MELPEAADGRLAKADDLHLVQRHSVAGEIEVEPSFGKRPPSGLEPAAEIDTLWSGNRQACETLGPFPAALRTQGNGVERLPIERASADRGIAREGGITGSAGDLDCRIHAARRRE